jgi:hypothetical protein
MTVAYLSYRYSETGAKRRLNGAMERSTTPSALDDPTQSASAAAQQPEPRQVNGDGREATDKRTAANIEISTSAPKDLTVCVTHYFILYPFRPVFTSAGFLSNTPSDPDRQCVDRHPQRI